MSTKLSLVKSKNGILTRAYIEKVSEQITRAQLAVLNGIDADSITEAMKLQCRLAAKGDRNALQFILSMVGMGGGLSWPARQAVSLEQLDTQIPPEVGPEDDDDDDDDDQ